MVVATHCTGNVLRVIPIDQRGLDAGPESWWRFKLSHHLALASGPLQPFFFAPQKHFRFFQRQFLCYPHMFFFSKWDRVHSFFSFSVVLPVERMIWVPKDWAYVRVHITSMQMAMHTRNLSGLGITCLLSPALLSSLALETMMNYAVLKKTCHVLSPEKVIYWKQ